MKVAGLFPVLNRPSRAEPLLRSFLDNTPDAYPMFLCSPADHSQIAAVAEAGGKPVLVSWPPGRGDYARKVNCGFRRAVALGYEWMFLGADDLTFHPGWFETAVAVHEKTGACVIGTNDHGNPEVMKGRHATHSLVHRDYLECGTVDAEGVILHEGYYHNWVDTEFIETAKARDTFAPAGTSVVEHLHPFWGKGADDPTYAKGREKYEEDRALYQRRRRLWA